MTRESYDFDELIGQLVDVNSWLADLGYTGNHRVRKYYSAIKRVIDAQNRGIFETFRAGLSPREEREFFWSVVDGDELSRALINLRQVPGLDIGPQLNRMLKGPVDLLGERADSGTANNDARNIAFEMIMTGRLVASGFRPYVDKGPDIQFEFASLQVAVQCKRLFSAKGLEKRTREAAQQLDSVADVDLKLAAISISRLLTPGDPHALPPLTNRDAVFPYLRSRFQPVIDAVRSLPTLWHRIDGLYLYGFTAVELSAERMWAPARYDILVPLTTKTPEVDYLKWLTQSINCSTE